jgi:hypothetical protein
VLGIKTVMKFTALVVDRVVELMGGKRLTVEIKFRMNWEKACQAEWQFRTLLKATDRKPFSVDGGLVFFEEFSGDWNRQAGSRMMVNGWSHWYTGHSEIDGLRLDLLRLYRGKIEGFPLADVAAILGIIKQLPSEKRNQPNMHSTPMTMPSR